MWKEDDVDCEELEGKSGGRETRLSGCEEVCIC